MNRLLRVDVLLIASVLLAGGFVGFLEAGEEPVHQTIEDGLEQLRKAFNANPDDVRAILLASPT